MKRRFRSKGGPILFGLLVGVALATTAEESRAGFTFLGPTPYLSSADSPFVQYLGGPDFYLEDFEDGELNTPGISQQNLAPLLGKDALGVINEPGTFSDSVDSDDGLIDGVGQAGRSMRSNFLFEIATNPRLLSFEMAFEFDRSELGYLPKAFGLVWTDGPEGSSFSFLVTTGGGEEIGSETIIDLGDASRSGGTGEDVFVGAIVPSGIVSVKVRGGFVGGSQSSESIEIDHVQYGLIVPEPEKASMFGLLLLAASIRRSRRIHELYEVT